MFKLVFLAIFLFFYVNYKCQFSTNMYYYAQLTYMPDKITHIHPNLGSLALNKRSVYFSLNQF
jgi:hypothetical protein